MDLPVVELRRYTLVPGRRDELISVFERHLMESQQDTGMVLLGTFRDLDRPDHFVWLRGFPDMESRRASLAAFYSGPVWREYGPVANSTMIDSDDVYLLRPAGPGTGLSRMPLPPLDATPPDTVLYVTIRDRTDPPARDAFAHFVTEPAENTFPALPVHENVSVSVVLTRTAPEGDGVARLAPTARSPLR
jgi:hypothetical protein